ncbi:MAG: hypothetical protein KA436_06065 [Oligoflexales bacterium]|nr:hypothetical protein [Oligoflexales bacterium]
MPISKFIASKLKNHKIREWLARYLPSELAGTISMYLGYYWIWTMTEHPGAASYAAAISENVGFYGIMLFRELLLNRRNGLDLSSGSLLKSFTDLLLEFGPSELLDSLVLRPLCIGLSTHYLGHNFGIFAGKLVSDVFFFIPTILMYELNKKRHKSS